MDVVEKLKIATLRILNMNNLRLFGCMFYNFNVSLSNGKNLIEESIKRVESEDPKLVDLVRDALESFLTAYVFIDDGKPHIVLYDSFIEKKSPEELTFVLLHEILHFLKGDTYRGMGKDQTLYNLAADHVINTSLIKDINDNKLKKVEDPGDGFTIPRLKDKNMSTEEVYEYLKSKAKVNPVSKLSIPSMGGQGETDGRPTNVNISNIEIDGKHTVQIEDIEQNSNESQVAQEKQITESLKSEARALMNQEQIGKGMASGSLKDLITKIIEVEIPWEKLLERALLTKIVPDADNRIWTNPLKRLRAHGHVLPGRGTSKKASVAVICIDTSGSISQKNLQQFSSIVLQAFSKFDELWVMKHDVRIHENVRIKTSEATADDIISSYNGRGGTSHKYVFKEIQKSFELKKQDIGIVILLTDFDSDVERIWPKHTWTKRIPVSVVLTRNRKIPSIVDPHPVIIKDEQK